jgi:hypothetical protein
MRCNAADARLDWESGSTKPPAESWLSTDAPKTAATMARRTEPQIIHRYLRATIRPKERTRGAYDPSGTFQPQEANAWRGRWQEIIRDRLQRASQLRDSLAAVPLFSSCSKRDLQIVARHIQVLSLPANTELIRQGDRGDAFYILLEGEASVHRDGRQVAVVRPGDHVGELALLDPAPRDASVTACSDVVIGVLGARVFNAIVRDVPAMNAKLLRALARRLRELDLQSAPCP